MLRSGIAINGGASVDDVQGVTPAVRWVPDDPLRGEFVAGDISGDQLAGGMVNVDTMEVEDVQRLSEPTDTECEDPEIQHMGFTQLTSVDYVIASGLCVSAAGETEAAFVVKTPPGRFYDGAPDGP